jgi:hypothetical protein
MMTLTRGGPLALRPRRLAAFASVNSDGRKPFTAGLNFFSENSDYGGWIWESGLNIGIKTSSRWNLTAGPNFSRAYTPAQFVQSVADPTTPHVRSARVRAARQTSLGLETRFNHVFAR